MQLPIWASKETVENTMPVCVKYDYPFTRVILDCTEILLRNLHALEHSKQLIHAINLTTLQKGW